MKHIKRYEISDHHNDPGYVEAPQGCWVRWEDVADIQQELQEMTSRAFAAVWLLVQEGIELDDQAGLAALHEEARNTLFGEDKKTIAKLQDEVRNLQEELRSAHRPPPSAPVYRVVGYKKEDPFLGYVLQLRSMQVSYPEGWYIEVNLP